MTKWYCDICGKEIDGSDIEQESFVTNLTYCNKCYKKFVAAAKNIVKKMRQEIKESSEQTKTSERNKSSDN